MSAGDFSVLLSAFGLAAAAGLNAWLPMLIVALFARFGWVALHAPFDVLASDVGVLVLLALVVWETVVDKVPGLDHLNDLLGTVARPAAGAALFLANGNLVAEANPVLAVVLGALAAGSLHTVKAGARPVVNVATLGTGAPVVSTLEDGLAAVMTVLALVAPFLAFGMLVGVVVFLVRLRRGPIRLPRRPGNEGRG